MRSNAKMDKFRDFVEAMLENSELSPEILGKYDSLFEGNYHKPLSINTNHSAMGGYENIMKQVGVGIIGGGGAMVDPRPGMHHVPNTSASTRDLIDEMDEWGAPKMKNPPIKTDSPKFVKDAIKRAQNHIPIKMEMPISETQKRFAAIYPTLNNGINTALPNIM